MKEKILERNILLTEYVLKNTTGIEVRIINYGLKITSVNVPDRNNEFEDIVLGFLDIDQYLYTKEIYFGSTIGRFCSRICNGEFYIGEHKYILSKNDQNNHLHGGLSGFHSNIWDVKVIRDKSLECTIFSNDLSEGFPGNLKVIVNMKLTEENELIISYNATTDKKTIINFTNHSYFNLSGEGVGNIEDHILQINADYYTPVNQNLIPTGEIKNVSGTPFDFTKPKRIGQDIEDQSEQLEYGKGYDHNFIIKTNSKVKRQPVFAARILSPRSGRVLEISTTEPGIQLYTGNFLDGKVKAKKKGTYLHRGGFCLETQHFPDSPNHDNFPSTLLIPNEKYESTTIYRFLTE
ncbi:aldose epimerase family protein [Aquimarina latercula]|uniref:aldose epimerase family protein n=1 Tax=Aquimarina latercula TaxID=987 RepID=UPI0003FB87D8|nr:aldose epimerase family protein [Aquimarina latercula]